MKNGRIHETDVANPKKLEVLLVLPLLIICLMKQELLQFPPLDCREQEPGVMRTDDYKTYFMNEEGTNKLMIKINWVERN